MKLTWRKLGIKQRLYFNLNYVSKDYILWRNTFYEHNPIKLRKFTKTQTQISNVTFDRYTNRRFITDLPKTNETRNLSYLTILTQRKTVK